ncbi:MAG: preprotein translocase subunit YajC [Dehalococcoidia bacterium]|nr:preprotein translocase subunit YajC [Dehalococcoidia bacterium]
MDSWYMIIFLVGIFAVMYFLMIRPRQKQQKQQEAMMAELRPGDKVIMAGGIYGQIESLGEDTAIVKIESGATMKVARNSILGKQEGEETSSSVF